MYDFLYFGKYTYVSAEPVNHKNEFLLTVKSLMLCENIVSKIEIWNRIY